MWNWKLHFLRCQAEISAMHPWASWTLQLASRGAERVQWLATPRTGDQKIFINANGYQKLPAFLCNLLKPPQIATGAVLRRLRNLRAFIRSHNAAVKPRNRRPGTRINSIGQAMARHRKPSNPMRSGRQNQKMCIGRKASRSWMQATNCQVAWLWKLDRRETHEKCEVVGAGSPSQNGYQAEYLQNLVDSVSPMASYMTLLLSDLSVCLSLSLPIGLACTALVLYLFAPAGPGALESVGHLHGS